MENGEKGSEKGSQKKTDLTIFDEKQPNLSVSNKKTSKKNVIFDGK